MPHQSVGRSQGQPQARAVSAILNKANFGCAEPLLRQTQDADCTDLRDTLITRAQLRGASFKGAQLQGAGFLGASLQGASFVGARLQGAMLNLANLQGANLKSAQLQAA